MSTSLEQHENLTLIGTLGKMFQCPQLWSDGVESFSASAWAAYESALNKQGIQR